MSDENELLSKDCDASVIRDLATGISEVNRQENGIPFVVIPRSYDAVALECMLLNPVITRARPRLETLASLIAYVESFKGNDTAIFAHPVTGTVEAIIDYHATKGKAAWREHRAIYGPKHSVEWERWKSQDDKWQDQRAFAEFIENNVQDIIKPAGAQMLEMASTLEAKITAEFKSGVRLDNGTSKLTFNTDTATKAGEKGDLIIPDKFELALKPFLGGAAFPVIARFRYKIDAGTLKLKYQLVNPHLVIESAVEHMIQLVATGTGIKPFHGTP
jgi:uncharacterized protein YfdQ (DUF2303 family)